MKTAALLLGLSASFVAWSAPGSWTAEVKGLRLGVAERTYRSAPLQPPGAVEARITSVWWRYSIPPGRAARVELCQAEHCILLPSQRGRSEAFAGAAAESAFYFRARREPGGHSAVELNGLQLIVNHRPGLEASKSPH